MDIISSYQLQKYEEILAEINSEFEKCEQLKKEIQQVENKITFLKLNVSPCRKKIGHVNVKVFSNITEIENLYDNVVDHMLINSASCDYNFFLIEVILTNSLVERLTDLKWRIHLCVRNDTFCTNKVVPVDNNVSILEVIPVVNSVYECVVETSLFETTDHEWNIIDLCSVAVDISYFFDCVKEKTTTSVLDKLANICKLYNNQNLPYVKENTSLLNQVKCSLNKNDFVSTFIQNSYHRLNLEAFSEFVNDNKRVVDIQFSINSEKVVVLYHKDTNIVKIKCSPLKIGMIRNFFIQHSTYDPQEFKNKLEKIKLKRNEIDEWNLEELLDLYQQLRKLWM